MKLFRAFTVATLSVATFLVAASAFAQSPANLSSADKDFVKTAAEGGLAEVELGHLAADKAATTQVKQFGDRMVRDHSEANEKLKDIAQGLGVSVPDHMSAMDYAEKTKLSAISETTSTALTWTICSKTTARTLRNLDARPTLDRILK